MNPDGSEVTRLTDMPIVSDGDASWSPDGTKIVFSSTRDGLDEIYTMNPEGTGIERLTFNFAIDRNPDWGAHPISPLSPPALTVNALDTNDGPVRMFGKILSSNGTVLQKGFTPLALTGESGATYTVAMSSYVGRTLMPGRMANLGPGAP